MAEPFYTDVTVPDQAAPDQSVQSTNKLAISNVKADVDPLLSQRPPIDFTPRTEAPPVVKSPFSILGAPSAATGAFLGSLIDKPGQLGAAAQAGGAAFLKAPFQDVADQPSPSNALRQRGIEMPGVSGLFADVMLDPTNLVGGEPITGTGKAALAMAAATPGVLKGLKGLTSRIISDVLPQIGKKGATGERIMSLFSKGTVAADELTPALTAWLTENKHTPITREALEQAVADKGLQLAEKTRGTPWTAGEEPAGSTKWTQYTLSGGENHRESLIRAIPMPGNPADVTWRELTGDEVLGYAAPQYNVPEMPRVWIANDPERTRITQFPGREMMYRLEGAHGHSRDYASREAALAAYEHQVQTQGYRYSVPEQRLVKAEDGSYHWTAEGTPDAIVRPVDPSIGRLTPAYNVVFKGEQQNYRALPLEEALSSARETQLANFPREASLQYTSSHWQNDPNTLVHVRGSDHELEGGGKALHLDEVQSDWHTHEKNGGRYYGYMKPNGEWIPPEYTVEKLDGGTVKVQLKAISKHRRMRPVSATGATEAEALAKLRDQFRANIPPDAPFKGHKADELAFKTWLARAAENGYDALTWTTADQQAERYDRLLRDITAIRLTEDGELEAKTSHGWKQVEGHFAKPEDTAAVIGQDAAARLAASDKAPSWEFTITDPQGEEKTLKFTNNAEAQAAWEEESGKHSTGAQSWSDLTSEQQAEVREAWEDAARDDFSDSAHEAASNWLDNEVESHLQSAEPDIFDSAKERTLEWAKEEGIDVDGDTFDFNRGSGGYRLYKNGLRDSHGQPLPMHVQNDIARHFEDDANELLDQLREEKTKELQESDEYFDAMSEGESEAMNDAWTAMSRRDKLDLAREHLDSDVFDGDGYAVGDVNKIGGAWHIDLSEHPLTIGSKGMEGEYDRVLPKLAQQISNRYGDGTKVQKLRINAEEAPNIVVARITSTTNDPRRVRLETPDGDTFSRYLPATWESRLAQPDTWVLYDPSGVIQDTAPFASREEAEAAAAAARAKRGPAMHEVWGLPISDKLRSFIKEKGLPLASVLWPAVGSVVTMKDGTRVRVKAHRDDGTFDGTPVTKGTISAQPER